MIVFEYREKGHERVVSTFRRVATRGQKEMEDTTYLWAAQRMATQLQAKPYPPERPRQRYVRTGQLGRSWGARRSPGGATIFNNRPYARYVVGDDKGKGQAWMHAGRWWLAADVIRDERPTLGSMLKNKLKSLFSLGAGR